MRLINSTAAIGVSTMRCAGYRRPVTGRRSPAQRMVLTPMAAVELINRMQQVGAALTQAGLLKANPPKTTN